ncbi:hypothetical protein GCM10010327_53690 [Streptomyces nitrosporeus]|nr:hypothetical protein GCM10010327_53690 [Streptomyces nitrosporeus]
MSGSEDTPITTESAGLPASAPLPGAEQAAAAVPRAAARAAAPRVRRLAIRPHTPAAPMKLLHIRCNNWLG